MNLQLLIQFEKLICYYLSNFSLLLNIEKFKYLVCPISAINCKEVNRYLELHFKSREKIDLGV